MHRPACARTSDAAEIGGGVRGEVVLDARAKVRCAHPGPVGVPQVGAQLKGVRCPALAGRRADEERGPERSVLPARSASWR